VAASGACRSDLKRHIFSTSQQHRRDGVPPAAAAAPQPWRRRLPPAVHACLEPLPFFMGGWPVQLRLLLGRLQTNKGAIAMLPLSPPLVALVARLLKDCHKDCSADLIRLLRRPAPQHVPVFFALGWSVQATHQGPDQGQPPNVGMLDARDHHLLWQRRDLTRLTMGGALGLLLGPRGPGWACDATWL
jgi:hypothetical protein